MNNSPWAKFTTSMIPKISVSPEATSARIMPTTMPLIVWIRICSSKSDSQIFVDDLVVRVQLGGRRVMAYGAFFHEIHALAGLEGQRDVLLHQQHRDAFAAEHVDDVPDLRHHARHQRFGRLIQQDDLRLEDYRARDLEHLLLSAAQRAPRLAAPFRKHGKIVENHFQQL